MASPRQSTPTELAESPRLGEQPRTEEPVVTGAEVADESQQHNPLDDSTIYGGSPAPSTPGPHAAPAGLAPALAAAAAAAATAKAAPPDPANPMFNDDLPLYCLARHSSRQFNGSPSLSCPTPTPFFSPLVTPVSPKATGGATPGSAEAAQAKSPPATPPRAGYRNSDSSPLASPGLLASLDRFLRGSPLLQIPVSPAGSQPGAAGAEDAAGQVTPPPPWRQGPQGDTPVLETPPANEAHTTVIGTPSPAVPPAQQQTVQSDDKATLYIQDPLRSRSRTPPRQA